MVSEAFQLINPPLIRAESRSKGKRKETAKQRLTLLKPVTATTADASPQTHAEPDPVAGWLALYSTSAHRDMIRAIRAMAEQMAAPMRADRERLKTVEQDALKFAAKREALRLGVLEEFLESLESMDTSPPALRRRNLLKMRASTYRQEQAAAMKKARITSGARQALRRTQPSAADLVTELVYCLPAWCRRSDHWGVVARLLTDALASFPHLVDIIAGHALTWAWQNSPPVRWLSTAGYHPSASPKRRHRKQTLRSWVARHDLAFSPRVPVGTVVEEIPDADLDGPDREAVRRRRAADLKGFDARREHRLWQVRESLPAELRALYDIRKRMWDDTGSAGRHAEDAWLEDRLPGLIAANPDLEALRARPRSPTLVVFRWPDADGAIRYAEGGVDVDPLGALPETEEAPAETLEAPTFTLRPPPRPLLACPTVVLDTETTGLSRTAEVCEIGAVLLDESGVEIAHFSELARPEDLRGPGVSAALRISGITRRELLRARPVDEVLEDFVAWWTAHDCPPCLAHNLPFDRRMLGNHGVALRWGEDTQHTICRALSLGKKRIKLTEAVRQLGIAAPAQNHRALDDVRLTVLCLLEALRRLSLPLHPAGSRP